MILKERIIDGELSDQINRFLYVKAKSDEVPEVQLLPTGYIYYTLILGERGKFCRNSECTELPRHFIGGQINAPGIFLRPHKNYIHFGIEFKPWALHEWIGLDIEHAENSFIKPKNEFFDLINNVLESEPFNFENSCNQLEQLLIAHKKPKRTPLSQTIRLITSKKGKVTIDELAEIAGFSKRHFRRKFKRAFGISPKAYSKTVQFNSALAILAKNDRSINLDLAFEGGYYDEAHFVNKFKELVGCSPAHFLEKPDTFLETYLLRN